MRIKDLSQEIIEDICKRYESGISSVELGKRYGCSDGTITKLLRNQGIGIRCGGFQPNITQKERENMISLFKEGNSQAQIGAILGYSQVTVRRHLSRLGIKPRTRSYYDTRKYCWNEEYFDSIDTPNKAYWLGWVVSDGYVDRKHNLIRIALAEQDSGILEKLNKEVGSDRPILWMQKRNERCQNQVRLSLTSSHAIGTMQSYGLISPKTFTVRFPDYIPEKLIPHFIRGEWDGDGSCSTKKTKTKGIRLETAKVVGTENLLLGIQKRFDSLGIISKVRVESPKKNNNIRRLSVTRRDEILKIRDYLYPPGDYLYLQRKRDKFFELA